MTHKERIEQLLSPLNCKVCQDYLDTKNIPKEYVIYSIGLTHNRHYADGKVFLKQPYCRIDCFSDGIANYTLGDQVENLIDELNAHRINVGYLEDIKRTQVTFEFYLI